MKRFVLSLLALLALALSAPAATLTVQTLSRAGVSFTANAVSAGASGDKWANTGAQYFQMNNGSGSSVTLTLTYGPGGVIDGQTLPNRTVVVAAGANVLVGPFPTNLYNDASGNMNVSYSATASVTVMVFQPGT